VARDHGENELLACAVAGDRLALGRLLLPCYEPVATHIAQQLPQALEGVVEVDDLVQQTFAVAIRKISKFQQRADASLPSWLKKIAENQVRDTADAIQRLKRAGQQKRQVRPVVEAGGSVMDLVDLLSDHGDTPSRGMRRDEAARAVRVGVATLAEEQQRAICLHYLEGRSVDATAAAMRRSPGAVRGLLQRARQSLRATLGASSRWFR
jgi:RNA polymerase sigma-70 factor (ECF subfamily)